MESKVEFQSTDEVLRAAQRRRSSDLCLWLGGLRQMRRETLGRANSIWKNWGGTRKQIGSKRLSAESPIRVLMVFLGLIAGPLR